MKTVRYLCLFCLCLISVVIRAQDIAAMSDSAFAEYMKSLKNKGNDFYMLSNRTGIKQVIDSCEEAFAIRKNVGKLTEEHEFALMQNILKLTGDYHYENSDFDDTSYAEAEKCFKAYRDNYLSHPESYVAGQGVYVAHQELAQLYYKQGRYQEACDEMKEVMASVTTYMEDEDEQFDKMSQYAICLARVNAFDDAISRIDEVLENYEDTISERYGETLRKKAKILLLKEEHGEEVDGNDALNCYVRYFHLKKKDVLAHFSDMSSKEREQYWMRIRPFVTDCYRLENADAGFLYDVTLFAKGLLLQLDSAGGRKQNIHATWQMIQKQLQPEACAIEFVQYEKGGVQQMGALVLRKTGLPVFVKMPCPKDIMAYKVGPRTVEERLYSIDGKLKNALYSDSLGFFKYIWNEQLLMAIGNSKKVFFAPDGYVHQIAIEYLLPEEARTIEMHRLSSTRSLLEHSAFVSQSKALVIGGVDYDCSVERTMAGNDTTAYVYLKGAAVFKPLDASVSEVRQIVNQRRHSDDSLIVGQNATEETFRAICGRYPLIHLSTHGVFTAAKVAQGTDIKPCLTDESLSQSIVALAGIQTALNSDNFDAHNQEGALSAKEISSLDMKNVELVVLSCCETGLGYVTADGVYGIQRGLKNAGVTAIICTLWDVWDVAATFFMTNFYRYLSEGNSIYQAFTKARGDMQEYENDDFSHPADKDVFILTDAVE